MILISYCRHIRLLFVVTSMLAMALASGSADDPTLKNVRLVVLALLANFVLVPCLPMPSQR